MYANMYEFFVSAMFSWHIKTHLNNSIFIEKSHKKYVNCILKAPIFKINPFFIFSSTKKQSKRKSQTLCMIFHKFDEFERIWMYIDEIFELHRWNFWWILANVSTSIIPLKKVLISFILWPLMEQLKYSKFRLLLPSSLFDIIYCESTAMMQSN